LPQEKKTTATKPARRPTVRRRKATAAAPVTHDAIAERAYYLYESGVDGGPFEHWLIAERELTAA
jgi:hypothetical protein